MLGGTIWAASAASQAAIARQEAQCVETLRTYDPNTTSVSGMQGYASCVQLLHPTHSLLPPGWEVWGKGLFLLLLGVFVVSAIRAYRDRYTGWEGVLDAAGAGMMTTVLTCFLLLVLGGSWLGLVWVFGGAA